MDKILLSSSLPKPSCIKEEEVGENSEVFVEPDSEQTKNEDLLSNLCAKSTISKRPKMNFYGSLPVSSAYFHSLFLFVFL